MTDEIAETFRTEWPRLVAILMRDLGDLDLAEDAAQEAFMEASKRWSDDGIPDRPGAWLTTTARRKAIDRIRRSNSYAEKLAELEVQARTASTRSSGDGLVDEQLALLLGCCHPALAIEAQVALTLRAVGGLTTHQIARAFLVPEATMGKRLTRAKEKIRKAGIPFEPVDQTTLEERLAVVRQVVYLIFTEGHASATEDELVRGDLCDEAAWLAQLLTTLVPDDGESHGLAALILLTDARRATRVDEEGVPILLEDQNRELWDRDKVLRGLRHLQVAGRRGPLGPYGLQAGVASFHATAPEFSCTDWTRVLVLYDRMLADGGGEVVALNRAVAVSYVEGAAAGLAAVDALRGGLDDYVYFHSARAELLRRLDRSAEARAAYELALQCRTGPSQHAFLAKKLAALSE